MYSLLVVFSDCIAGRDAEFNSWYSDVHIHDALKSARSTVAAQRFRRSELQPRAEPPQRHLHRYLAVYEMSDPQDFTAGHKEVFSPAMPISDSYSFEHIEEAYYDELLGLRKTPGRAPEGGLIIERLGAEARLAEWYMSERFGHIMNLPAIVAGTCAQGSRHQMYKLPPEASSVVIYRTEDLAVALSAWQKSPPPAQLPVLAASLTTDAFEPITHRLTAIEALNPDAAMRERTRRAREALGTRVHQGAPGFTGFR